MYLARIPHELRSLGRILVVLIGYDVRLSENWADHGELQREVVLDVPIYLSSILCSVAKTTGLLR